MTTKNTDDTKWKQKNEQVEKIKQELHNQVKCVAKYQDIVDYIKNFNLTNKYQVYVTEGHVQKYKQILQSELTTHM